MEADTANRYRSRILREMNANRDNPFNSPPSSTGSHGSVTLSSVFSDPDGESTRKLNEDIARVTAPKKLPVNLEAAHRKWPEFYSMPKKSYHNVEDNTDTRPLSPESKESKPPVFTFDNDDSTQDPWQGSVRPRSEMQPRVDSESDMSSILDKSPARGLSAQAYSKNVRHPSPLSKVQTNRRSSGEHEQRRSSLNDALDQLRKTSKNHEESNRHTSPHLSSAKSSLTAVPSSPEAGEHNASHVRSFFMPDVTHLNDFVTGTLRFNGSMKNGVPIFVKRGQVFDRSNRSAQPQHAEVDGMEVPEDEEKIFVSMDMIREEIVSLQDHYDKVQEYASNLQQQVESLENQLKSRPSASGRSNSDHLNTHLQEQKNRLEVEVSSLQSRLEQASRYTSLKDIENDSLTQERDRFMRKLQEACEDINKLTRKLSTREKELETSHKQLESTEQMRQDNDALRQDVVTLKHGRDALELENSSLRNESDGLHQQVEDLQKQNVELTAAKSTLQKQHQSLIAENRSLRSSNQALLEENEELRNDLENARQDIDIVREEANNLRDDMVAPDEDKDALREDNESLVRHNEKYFNENKMLRKENAGFERSVHELQDEKRKLKQEVVSLKEQLDHCRPIPKDDFSARLDEETDENMTSAFFVPDITMNTNGSAPMDVEETETQELPMLPEITARSNKLSTIVDVTEDQTRKSAKDTWHSRKSSQQGRNASKASKASSGGKVAFAVPETHIRASKSTSNLANQGSKRRTTSQSVANKRTSLPNLYDENDDTTGVLSGDNTTQDYSVPLHEIMRSRKEAKADQRQSTREMTERSQVSQHARSQSRASTRRASVGASQETSRATQKNSCPALTKDARRVLDDLCEHNCRNCTVCSRISSHRGVVTATDFANGKKRVTVSRPIPVTDRDLTAEDPTMRPAHSPGHALAMVIKGLEDESQHLQLELTRLQSQYNGSDKALGRRDRLTLAESIRTLLKQLEAKNDQIYSLYDVLEGQKAAGQAMTEEEVEMTVLNITGMTIRDVTGGTEQLTWEGIVDL